MTKVFKQWSVKHRPSTFDEVIDNDQAKEKARQIIRKKDTHAILLYGETGCGKTTLAKLIAKGLTKVPSDITEKNISDERGIDAVRALIRSSMHLPQGDFKVYILDEVHALLGQAQSTILKTLEEPEHDRVVWILCTDRPHALSAPLLNRLYKIEVSKPSKESLAKLLYKVAKDEKAFTLAEEKLKRLCIEVAKASDRVPRQALQILKEVSDMQGQFENFKDLVINGVRKMNEESTDKIVIQIMMAFYSESKSFDERLKFLINLLYDAKHWDIMLRLTDMHFNLLAYLGGVRCSGFYTAKELEPHKAVPNIKQAAYVSTQLVELRERMQTVTTGIQHLVVPKLIEIMYKLEKS